MTTDTLTLADFLLARIAEDEEWAEHVDRSRWTSRIAMLDGDLHPHVSRYHPARVLAECEAKRRIVGMWSLQMSEPWGDEPPAPIGGQGAEVYYETLQLLALPYADHPDFRDEWRA